MTSQERTDGHRPLFMVKDVGPQDEYAIIVLKKGGPPDPSGFIAMKGEEKKGPRASMFSPCDIVQNPYLVVQCAS